AGDVRAVAADLIAQAEHDEDASAWCVTTSARLADALPGELARQVARSPRRVIVERSLADHGVVVVVPDLDAAVEVANRRAPEHVELLVGGDPWPLVERIRHAGAIFVGGATPEPVGDYVAGPLPAHGSRLPLDVQCTHRVPSRLESRRRMQTVLAITAGVMIAEAIGGWLAHSLALLADAGHMLADVAAIGLSLAVAYLAQR